MKRLWPYLTLILLFTSVAVSAAAQTAKSTSDSIRDAQTKAASVRDLLRIQSNTLPAITDAMRRIDMLSDKKGDLQTSVQGAKMLAQAAKDSLTKISSDSTTSLEQLRLLDSHLDAALTSTEANRNGEGALKQIDEAMTPTVATSLAAASLTLAGLLFGLGMPLLLSQPSLLTAAGAAKPSNDFRIQVARAGVFTLKAFACFAIAILENLTLDPNDAAFLGTLKTNAGLWTDVGINMTALVAGIAFLVRAGTVLTSRANQLIRVWLAIA